MVKREAGYALNGTVQVDDAYLGGALDNDTTGRGSENRVPFPSAASLDADGHTPGARFAPVPAFSRKAVAQWPSNNQVQRRDRPRFSAAAPSPKEQNRVNAALLSLVTQGLADFVSRLGGPESMDSANWHDNRPPRR